MQRRAAGLAVRQPCSGCMAQVPSITTVHCFRPVFSGEPLLGSYAYLLGHSRLDKRRLTRATRTPAYFTSFTPVIFSSVP